MVSKKKAAKKDAGTAEKVEETQEVSLTLEAPTPTDAEIVSLKKEVAEMPAEETVITTPQFVDETSKLLKLLGEAPPVPFIRTVEEAVAFVDKYAVWKRNVKAIIG